MIALVGDAYGFELEETEGHAEQPRCSYTQWEYFFAMGERLDGSRQTPKEIFLYFASPEFLAMHAVSQPGDAAQLQQEFIKELHRSGKDWNRFGLLDELRALVLRDGFRLQTRPPQSRNLPYTARSPVQRPRAYPVDTARAAPAELGRALAIYGPAGVLLFRFSISRNTSSPLLALA